MAADATTVAPSPPSPDGTRCRVAVVSDAPGAAALLPPGFEASPVPFAGAEQRLARLSVQVVLVDAAAVRRFAEVASYAANWGVVVLGPPGEPGHAMRYLDLGAADYVSTEASSARACAPWRGRAAPTPTRSSSTRRSRSRLAGAKSARTAGRSG